MHKLALVAVLGLTGSAICIGAAAAIGGREFGQGWDGMDFSMFGDRPRCERIQDATATSRDLDWDGSDHFSLAVPGRASYTPGGDNKVHVSGDPQLLAHLRVRDGRLELDCRSWHGGSDALTITLPGQEFKKFGIAGSGNTDIAPSDEADIHIAGSGDVNLHSNPRKLETHIAGSGRIHNIASGG